MASLRHNSDHQPKAVSGPEHAYLDAARACILDVGWRRTTLTEVARRSGVSRMTIYRRWSDMPTLLGDLMTREWGGIAAAHQAEADLVEAMVATVRALRDNELFVRIVELDPELLLPYVLHRRGRSQQAILDLLEARLASAQEAGGSPRRLPRGDRPRAAARRPRLRALRAHDARRLRQRADLDHELRQLLTRTVAP